MKCIDPVAHGARLGIRTARPRPGQSSSAPSLVEYPITGYLSTFSLWLTSARWRTYTCRCRVALTRCPRSVSGARTPVAIRVPALQVSISTRSWWLMPRPLQGPWILLPRRVRPTPGTGIGRKTLPGAAPASSAASMLAASNRTILCYHACIHALWNVASLPRPVRSCVRHPGPGLALSIPEAGRSAQGSGSLRGTGSVAIE